MSQKEKMSLSERHLDEIWEEICLLEGSELDVYLNSIGLDPNALLQDYLKSVEGSAFALKRSRFEEAKRHVRRGSVATASNVISLDVARKRQIFAEIKDRVSQSKDMTIAARNQKIDSEEDLDGFLEACIELGMIDEDGNPKS